MKKKRYIITALILLTLYTIIPTLLLLLLISYDPCGFGAILIVLLFMTLMALIQGIYLEIKQYPFFFKILAVFFMLIHCFCVRCYAVFLLLLPTAVLLVSGFITRAIMVIIRNRKKNGSTR